MGVRPFISQPVICIVGATATGKTALAQKVAERIDGEVISADSMQIYRGMDIGTGKISPAERSVPYHGLDICDPGTPYSAALFQNLARRCFVDIERRDKRSVLCGGTGLYVRAAIDDYNFPAGEQLDNTVREHYTRVAEAQGAQVLWSMLKAADPASAEVIHPNNTRRVIRAFELLAEGKHYSDQQAGLSNIKQEIPAIFFGLAVETTLLNQRIDARVDAMIEGGLIGEVKDLLEKGFREGVTAVQAIGYKEIVAALEGDISLDEAIAKIKIATHRYAKRQRTWFRKEPRIHWLCADSQDTDRLTDQVFAELLQ
ncbi:MAG: tRNA (adenosine(37)-N6)-dimethylallyltransferase MiaA [Raoultibacter sp.]